jgi:hypothetical protein
MMKASAVTRVVGIQISIIVSWIGAASSITCSQSLCRYDNNYLMCVVARIVYIVKYGLTLWHNCFATKSRV